MREGPVRNFNFLVGGEQTNIDGNKLVVVDFCFSFGGLENYTKRGWFYGVYLKCRSYVCKGNFIRRIRDATEHVCNTAYVRDHAGSRDRPGKYDENMTRIL